MRGYWDSILNFSMENNIFLTWEKMAPSVNHMKKEHSLKILCAYEGDRIVGIAPFRKTRKSVAGNFGYSIIEPLTNGNTDYTGMIMSEQEKEILNQFLEYLFKQKDWDLFYFPDLPSKSSTLELIMQNRKELPKCKIEKGWVCPFLPLPNSKEKLLAGLRRKFRKNLERQMRKMEREQGKIELKNYYELGSLEQGMKILFKLHQKRWKAKGGPGKFGIEENRNIAMKTAQLFAQKDWLRLYFLTVNDKPVAAFLALEYDRKMYGHLCGFNPDYSQYGVGHLLLLKIFEKCIEKGITEFDFMQGSESYKFDWTRKYRQSINVRFVNKRLSSKVINFLVKTTTTSYILIHKILRKVISQQPFLHF